jgi:hypothetical protein
MFTSGLPEVMMRDRVLHDAFGGLNRCADLSGVMKDLIRIKEAQTAR